MFDTELDLFKLEPNQKVYKVTSTGVTPLVVTEIVKDSQGVLVYVQGDVNMLSIDDFKKDVFDVLDDALAELKKNIEEYN